MKPNPDTFGPGVRRLNPGLFVAFPSLKPSEVHAVESTAQLPRNPLQLESKEDIKNEKMFQERTCSFLRMRGIVYGRNRMDKKSTGTPGWPDITFAFKGYPIAWELKMPGKVCSEDQIRCIMNMKKNGWHVKVLFTVEEVLKELHDMGAEELQ